MWHIRLHAAGECIQRMHNLDSTQGKLLFIFTFADSMTRAAQWANAKSVKNLGGLTARLDTLVSGSLVRTYTWSRGEVTINAGTGLMMDLGGY